MKDERPLSLRLAAIQTRSIYWDKEGNLARIRPLLEEAASKGAQLVLLPEMVAGYAYSFDIIWGGAELIPSGVTSQFI
jgi:predicted amidohydrolase